jgi:hypothetical protein
MKETKIDKSFALKMTLIVGAIIMACLGVFGWGFVLFAGLFIGEEISVGG